MRSRESTSYKGAAHLGIGVQFLVEIGVFAGLGWWLDGRWGTTPWLMVGGIGGGLAVATWHLLRQVGVEETEREGPGTREP